MKGESGEDLTLEERVQVRNAAAALRARSPGLGLRGLSAEVCRCTGILISPESPSAYLLGHLQPRRP